MKDTRLLMGMPIKVEIVDKSAKMHHINKVFDYFKYIDEKFSTYKSTSEVSRINAGKIRETDYSKEMKIIFQLAKKTEKETYGYFNMKHNGIFDPSGIVKGWAILQASQILKKSGLKNFYIDAGGDIQVGGKNSRGNNWRIGIRNPFNRDEIVKALQVDTEGVATSGTYIRGQHIYNPFEPEKDITEIISLTVIGPDVYEADRFATAAFAMGEKGIEFIEKLPGFEGYSINNKGIATFTSGFKRYIINSNENN